MLNHLLSSPCKTLSSLKGTVQHFGKYTCLPSYRRLDEKSGNTLMIVNYEAAVRRRLQFGQRGILLGLD